MASIRGHGHQGRSSQNSKTRCGKCCYYCRQVATFLFSHIGLCTLLLGYAFVGAFTFQAIESQNEYEQRLEMIRTRNDMIFELSNMTNHSIILNRENWTENAEKILREFELKFLHAVKYKGYDGSDELNKTSSQWDFAGSFLFSIIVITTIGYGNVAPRTDLGKLVTILYAIIGIPLMLFCLSNIGHAMAHSFKFIYWKCCCFLCVKPKKLQRRQRRRRRLIRLQRQRAMIMLTQPLMSSSTILENSANTNGTTANGGINQLPSMPLGRAAPSARPSHLPSSYGQTLQSGQLSEPNSSSSFSTTPALTPLTGGSSNTQQVFFTNATDASHDPSVTTNLGKPKKSNLARSFSARYHNDHSLPIYGPQLSATTANNLPSNNAEDSKSRKDKTQIPAIICNRYASLSDECIDAYRARINAEQPQSQQNAGPHSNTIQLKHPPRRTPSQVRFMPQPPPDLSVSSPSQAPQIPRPPPFPYPNGSEAARLDNGSDHVPPPPFDANYYIADNLNNASQVVPPYNYTDMNRIIVSKTELDSELDSDPDSDSDDDDITEKNIPITVCLTLVVGYICGGAWFFSTSEEWEFLDGCYFSFVTLSTIGFGDLVPGRTLLATTPEEGQMTLAICAIYLIFGMGLVAMSLSLIKEKVLDTMRTIGERIGILVNDDDDFY